MRTGSKMQWGVCGIAALAAVCTFGVVGCSGAQGGSGGAEPTATGNGESTASASQTARFDGETLARGIFFGIGPAASLREEVIGDTTPTIGRAIDAEIARLRGAGDADTAARVEALRARVGREGASEGLLDDLAAADPALRDPGRVERALSSLRTSDAGFFDRFADDVYSLDHARVHDALQRTVDAIGAADRDGAATLNPNAQCYYYFIAITEVYVYNIHYYWGESEGPSSLHKDEMVDHLIGKLAAR